MDPAAWIESLPFLDAWLSSKWLVALTVFVVTVLVARLVDVVGARVLKRLAERTATVLDDLVIDTLRHPVGMTVMVIGLYQVALIVAPPEGALRFIKSALSTAAIGIWSVAGWRLVGKMLEALASRPDRGLLVQPRTQPLFDIAFKVTGVGLAAYLLFAAWHVDVTAWVASAGIIGLAVGFAAQETLGSLFAGVFILADAPYRIGDFLVLDDGTRGRVTDIGLNSTRILTRDQVEIVIPNRIMASSRVQNESGGPSRRERVGISVQVAYSSDLDTVRQVLLDTAKGIDTFVRNDARAAPTVRFRSFDDSGITVTLFGWISRPEYVEEVKDEAIVAIHKAFKAHGIEIPFPQLDIHRRD